MHAPPAVGCRLGRSRWHLLLIGLIGSLALFGVMQTWLMDGVQVPATQMIPTLVASTAMVAFAGVQWYRTPSAKLQWDGASWFLQLPGLETESVSALAIALDLQTLVLVKLDAPSATRWFWLEPDNAAYHWRALRRALVYSHAARHRHRAPLATGIQDLQA